MGILSAVTSSQTKHGIRMVLCGVEGVGKTTLAVNAPRPLLVPLEAGYSGVVVNKVPTLAKYAYVLQLLDEIIEACAAGNFVYQSLIFDSATSLEQLIHQQILETDPNYSPGNKKTVTMDSALGGYGKAFAFSNQLFLEFLAKCDTLAIDYQINIILTCHVFSAKIKDPTAGEYDSWDLLLHSPKNDKTYGKREILTQWADFIGFIYEPLYVSEGDGKKMNKGISAGLGRMLGPSRTTSYVAKNRYALTSEIPIPIQAGWNHIAKAIHDSKGIDFFNRD